MTMTTIRTLFLSFVFALFSPILLIASENNNQLELWHTTYINKMSPAELQLLGNFLYLSCATAIIESKLHQFFIPISRLQQSIRSQIDNYQNPTNDVATLKTLLDRFSYVSGARIVHIETLKTLTNYYNENNTSLINAAIENIQLNGQVQLSNWANDNMQAIQQQLKQSSEIILNNIQFLQPAMEFYKGISENEFPFDIPKEVENDKALFTLDIIIKNNPELRTTTEEITNALNNLNEQATQIIAIGADIYKQYYTIVYDRLMSADYNKEYATTMFSMYGMLAQEYKTLLPDTNHIFEHALQTTKLYTQTEVLQHS